MKFTASQIAGILEGEVDGDASIEVSKLAKIEEGLAREFNFFGKSKIHSLTYILQKHLLPL